MTTSTHNKAQVFIVKLFSFMIMVGVVLAIASYLFGATTKTTPYRTSPYSSGASAQLRGVAGEDTEGDTLQGTWNSDYSIFEFDVTTSGWYTKWYDLLGGTNYERDTTWSDANGKWITGGNMGNAFNGYSNQRAYSQFDDIQTFARGSYGATELFFDKTTPDTLKDTTVVFPSGKTINFGNQLFVQDRNDTKNLDFDAAMFYTLDDSNQTFIGGRFDGMADSSITVSIQNVTTAQMDINLSGIATDSLKYWYAYVTSGTAANTSNRFSGNAASVAGWTTVYFSSTWSTPPDVSSLVKITPRNEFNHTFMAFHANNLRYENINISNMAGDGITLVDVSNATISNCSISNPNVWFTLSPYQLLLGRQAISLIAQPTTIAYAGDWTKHGKVAPTPIAYMNDLKIVHNDLQGGAPGAIDFEPNGVATIENCLVSENYIHGSYRGVAIENANSTFRNITISNNVFSENIWGGSLLSPYAYNIVYENNDYIDQDERVMWFGNYHDVIFRNNRIYQVDADTSVSYALESPSAVGTTLIIEGNTFTRWPGGQMYINGCKLVVIRNNSFIDVGYGRDTQVEGFVITNCDKVIYENNWFQNQSGTNYSRPGQFSYCDTVIAKNNYSKGGVVSDELVFWGCSVVVNENNSIIPEGEVSSADRVNLVVGTALVDSMFFLTDSLLSYKAIFDTSQSITFTFKGADSTYFVHGPDSTWTDSIFVARTDTMWIVGSSTFNATDITVYTYLYGEDNIVGVIGSIGKDGIANNEIAAIDRIAFPGYRDVIPRAYGASIEAWRYGIGYGADNQFTKLKFFTNWKGAGYTLSKPNDRRLGLTIEGYRAISPMFVLPTDSLDTPSQGDAFIAADSTLRVYFNGAWLTFDHD